MSSCQPPRTCYSALVLRVASWRTCAQGLPCHISMGLLTSANLDLTQRSAA